MFILSIDSAAMEVIVIFLSTQSRRRDVVSFLGELKDILCKEDFSADSDFILINKRKPNDEQYSTPYTLLDLNYDITDVIERLKELTVSEYSETKIDKDDVEPPLLFVFGKAINKRLIYIKIKIKEEQRRVLCVSFHYARDPMRFPYT